MTFCPLEVDPWDMSLGTMGRWQAPRSTREHLSPAISLLLYSCFMMIPPELGVSVTSSFKEKPKGINHMIGAGDNAQKEPMPQRLPWPQRLTVKTQKGRADLGTGAIPPLSYHVEWLLIAQANSAQKLACDGPHSWRESVLGDTNFSFPAPYCLSPLKPILLNKLQVTLQI